MIVQPPAHPAAPETPSQHQDEAALMAYSPGSAENRTEEFSTPSPGVNRLLVLVPDVDIDEADLAQRVWALAEPRHLRVVYLSAAAGDDRESLARRRLATLAAITRTDWLHVETRYGTTHNWPEAIRAVWQPGDLIVFPPEEVSPIVVTTLLTPVHVLSGMKVDVPPNRRRRLARLAFWPIALATIAGFFWIQALIEQAAPGWVRTILLGLSVLAELSLLMLWNALLS